MATARRKSTRSPRSAAPGGPAAAGDGGRSARLARRRDRSREEILEAARRVLLRDGIAATTLDAVATEAGLSKTALYYYFRSKDALYFELIFGSLRSQAQAVHDAVEKADDGADALGAIVRESVASYAGNLDDFRLAYLHGQVAGRGAVHLDSTQFARIRPLNELWFAGAAARIADDRRKRPGHVKVEPRLLAFLAYLAAVGLLTMKGMVENVDDPLVYTDEQVIEGFARVFAAAAGR